MFLGLALSVFADASIAFVAELGDNGDSEVVLLKRVRFLLLLSLLSVCLQAQTIVSLAPSLTEVTCAVGACDQLVGVTNYCLYPESVKSKEKVGGYLDANIERIAALNPDVVLVLPEHRDIRDKLEKLGLKVETIRNYHVKDIPAAMRTIGKLAGRETAGNALADEVEQEYARLNQPNPNGPKVMMVLGHGQADAVIKDLFIVGRQGFLNELLEAAGAQNAWTQTKPFFPKIGQEGLLMMDPDIIVELIAEIEVAPETFKNKKKAWKAIPHLRALKGDRYHIISSDHVLQAGPRYLETLKALRQIVEQQ